jgi:hypothetical protein
MTPVYLDYNATTPVDPDVLKAMLPFLQDQFGNPSSAHALGARAHDAVETARAEVAALIGAAPDRYRRQNGHGSAIAACPIMTQSGQCRNNYAACETFFLFDRNFRRISAAGSGRLNK